MIQCLALKDEGNHCVEKKDYELAIIKYRTALAFCTKPENDNDPVVVNAKLQLYSNLAHCHLKVGENDSAYDYASKALEIEPYHPKALYRRALAAIELKRYTECAQDLAHAVKTGSVPDQAIVSLLERFRKEEADKKNKHDTQSPELDLTDAMNLIKRFHTEENVSDLTPYQLGVEVVTSWLRAKANPQALHDAKLIPALPLALKRAYEIFCELPGVERKQHLVFINSILNLSVILMLDVADDESQSSDKIAASTIARRSCLANNFIYSEILRLERDLISASFAGEEGLLRKKTVRNIIQLLRYIGDLGDRGHLSIISEGLRTVEDLDVRDDSLVVLADLSHKRRELGTKVKCLVLTHELQCCLMALMELLDTVYTQGIPSLTTQQNQFSSTADFCLANLLFLLAEKDRDPNDNVNWDNLLDSLIGNRLGSLNEQPSDDAGSILAAYIVLNSAWIGAKDEVFAYSYTHYFPLLALTHTTEMSSSASRTVKLAAQFLIYILEYPEARQMVIDTDGIDRIVQKMEQVDVKTELNLRILYLSILARLSLHGADIRSLIFNKINFLNVCADVLDKMDESKAETQLQSKVDARDIPALQKRQAIVRQITNVLQTLMFISLHGSFKESLLNWSENDDQNALADEEEVSEQLRKHCDADSFLIRKLGTLGRLCLATNETEPTFLFLSFIQNLLRSRADKERLKKGKGAPDFDDDQMRQLEMLYEKLPEQAKPQERTKYDRGSPAIALAIRKILLHQKQVLPIIKEIVVRSNAQLSPNMAKLAAMCVRCFASHPSLRAETYRQGGARILEHAIDRFQSVSQDELRDFRQVIAQICLAVPPAALRYEEIMKFTAHLLKCLEDPYELFVYEAALTLTNFLSASEEARLRVWDGGNGWRQIEDLSCSDNDMMRAVGLELMCNLVASPAIGEEIAEELSNMKEEDNFGKYKLRLTLLLAFCGEYDNARAWTAAAGCVALLSSYAAVALALIHVPEKKFESLVTSLEMALAQEDVKVKHQIVLRLVTILTNIWKAIQWVCDNPEDEPMFSNSEIITSTSHRLFLFFGMVYDKLDSVSKELLDDEDMKLTTTSPSAVLFTKGYESMLPAVANFWSKRTSF